MGQGSEFVLPEKYCEVVIDYVNSLVETDTRNLEEESDLNKARKRLEEVKFGLQKDEARNLEEGDSYRELVEYVENNAEVDVPDDSDFLLRNVWRALEPVYERLGKREESDEGQAEIADF
ncbi:MAG: hypothetical protein ABEJ56_05995 [Candidatus Nanohaloarchaea archaeon]